MCHFVLRPYHDISQYLLKCYCENKAYFCTAYCDVFEQSPSQFCSFFRKLWISFEESLGFVQGRSGGLRRIKRWKISFILGGYFCHEISLFEDTFVTEYLYLRISLLLEDIFVIGYPCLEIPLLLKRIAHSQFQLLTLI